MYFGHYAVATAVKAKKPEIPALPLFMATGAMDMANGLFIMLGLDKVTANLNARPYLFFNLTFIDWDHSLLMGAFLSIITGLIAYLAYKKNKQIGLWSGLVAFSHWLADLPMHNMDMALFPGSAKHFGWGLWGSLGNGAWLLEVIFTIILLTYAYYTSKKQGENIWPQILFIALLTINMSPWLSPMKIIATFSNPWDYLVHGFLVLFGFVIPGLVFAWLYKKTGKRSKITL